MPSDSIISNRSVFKQQALEQELLAKSEEKSYLSEATNNIVQTGFTCIDEDEILSVLAQERERDEPICQIYDTEIDDVLDWTC